MERERDCDLKRNGERTGQRWKEKGTEIWREMERELDRDGKREGEKCADKEIENVINKRRVAYWPVRPLHLTWSFGFSFPLHLQGTQLPLTSNKPSAHSVQRKPVYLEVQLQRITEWPSENNKWRLSVTVSVNVSVGVSVNSSSKVNKCGPRLLLRCCLFGT